MNVLPCAVYAIEAAGECPHERAALARDVTVAGDLGPWYVWCLDCFASGPPRLEADEAIAAAWLTSADGDAPIGLAPEVAV